MKNMYVSPVSVYRSNPQRQSASAFSAYNSNPQSQPAFTGAGKALTALMLVLSGLGITASKVAAQTGNAVVKAGTELASATAPAAKIASNLADDVMPVVILDTLMKFKDHKNLAHIQFINTKGKNNGIFHKVELSFPSQTDPTKKPTIFDLEYLGGELAEDGKTIEKYFFGFRDTGTDAPGLTFWEEYSPEFAALFRNKKRFLCAIPFKP
jgi:hypothetical protein